MRESWSVSQMESKCSSLGLSESVVRIIGSSWAENSGAITSSLLSKIITANQLLDVDWSFGVTSATDDSDKVRGT